MQIQKHNTTLYEKGTLYSGQTFFNKLPEDLKNEYNVDIFKHKIKSHLLQRDIYKVSEFLKLYVSIYTLFRVAPQRRGRF